MKSCERAFYTPIKFVNPRRLEATGTENAGERPNLSIDLSHEPKLHDPLSEENRSMGQCLELAKARARNERIDLFDPIDSNDLKPDPNHKV